MVNQSWKLSPQKCRRYNIENEDKQKRFAVLKEKLSELVFWRARKKLRKIVKVTEIVKKIDTKIVKRWHSHSGLLQWHCPSCWRCS